MKKIAVILVALIGMLYIDGAECQPVEQETFSELYTWFSRCRNKLSHDERRGFLEKNNTQKEIFLRAHCMSVKNGGFVVPPSIKEATDNRQLKLDYIKFRSKQGGFLASGIVFLIIGVGDAIGARFAYDTYDKAPHKTALKDRMQDTTILLSVVSGVSIITSIVFFGASHKYRMDANGMKVDLQFAMNGISGTF